MKTVIRKKLIKSLIEEALGFEIINMPDIKLELDIERGCEIFEEVLGLEQDEFGIFISDKKAKRLSSLEGYDMMAKMSQFQDVKNFNHVFRKYIVAQYLKSNVKDHSDIIELGCGYCEVPQILFCDMRKYNYYCLDIDYNKLRNSSKRKIGRFNRILIQSDLSSDVLLFKDNRADAIVAIEFIEHISMVSAINILKECNRVLKSGGKIILSTPDSSAKDSGGGKIDASHIFEWDRREFLLLLEKCGFEISDCFGFDYMPSKTNTDCGLSKHLKKYYPSSILKSFIGAGDFAGAKSFFVMAEKVREPELCEDAFKFTVSEKNNIGMLQIHRNTAQVVI